MTPTRSKTTFPMHSLWLLLLLPGNALVLLDLFHGVIRPAVWLGRFFPALVVLSLVLWAHARATPMALRLRVELRLALASGLSLLLCSGASLVLDALPPGPVHGVLRTLPWVLGVILPAAAVLMPMSLEREQGTLSALLTCPLGARAFAEKFGLAALLVTLSWLQLSVGEQQGTELWWFSLGGHLLALSTVPTWFFLTQDEAGTLGLVVIAPFGVAVPLMLLTELPVIPFIGIYGAMILALLPAALRRGVAAGAPTWLTRASPGLGWLEGRARPLLRAELRGQRDAIILGGVALLGFIILELQQLDRNGATEAATLELFVVCAVAAVLSPALAFTEAQRLGTLDAQLTVQPRRAVFAHRALVSAATTGVISVVMPGAALAAISRSSLEDGAGWVLAIVVLWTVGLAAAVHLRSVGTALVAGVGLTLGLFVAQATLLLTFAWGAMSLLGAADLPPLGNTLAATLVLVAGVAAAVAWRRFNGADRLEPRVLLGATALCLGHATVLGAASVLLSMIG